MKLIMPSYCDNFKCSADKCKDNCCIGWEIDIDEATVELYSSVKGDFGERLRQSISHGDCHSFILKGERCPFLGEDNLCDIIRELGESSLCQICSDHPRYFEWYGNIKEGGIGLCCEEAAGLILNAENPTAFTVKEIPFEENGEFDEGLFELLLSAREKIFFFICDENYTIKERVARVLSFAQALQDNIDNYNDTLPEEYELIEGEKGDMLSVLKSLTLLEPIDEDWTNYLDKAIKGFSRVKREEEALYQRNLLIYFIYRYFLKGTFDGEILSKVKLALVSTAVISCLPEEKGRVESVADKARVFSKQLEYSEENLEMLTDMLYEKDFFENGKIIGLY